ncbi:uncharacterized protein LAESUDRAFT_721805 [Laetiporus sulphureus 93-53]|uniref:DUF6533 domain-containing protein n=1 Tax=Laetiporus sulphureus 93-53 TaxID=1314785 RepID=A0A165GJP4_9APHY|nr:uncharacterized protein LAESUDRAFT_721805 [Laetiporus sulphureus 93-53]KZT10446.1 hypothetical protein LAESUDRAFT_721805 [Laetiporus sulphureus 93-53]
MVHFEQADPRLSSSSRNQYVGFVNQSESSSLPQSAIFYYDYFLTFGSEYARIWKQPKTRGTLLFFLNRYLTFFGDVAVNVGNFYTFHSAKSCRDYALYRQVLLIGAQVVVCIILCLRTHALYHRNKRVLALMLFTGFSLAGVSIYAVTDQKQGETLDGGCHIGSTRITAIRIAVAWESLFVYDVIIFSLTLCKTWKERFLHPILIERIDILALMLRDGAMYFAVMASVNLANTLTFYFLPPLLVGALSTFASSVSVTMMSRLMLNLHESASAHPSFATNPSGTENSTTLLFTSEILMDRQAAVAATNEQDVTSDPDRLMDEEQLPAGEEYELQEISYIPRHPETAAGPSRGGSASRAI